MAGLSAEGYAKRRGVAGETVRKAVAAGRISTDADGRIDPVTADAEWAANTGRANNRSGVSKHHTKASADAAKTEEYTEYLRLKNAKLAGDLIDRASAEHTVATLAIEFRDQLLAWGLATAPMIAAESGGDQGAIRRCLDREARLLLGRMAERAGNLEFAESDTAEDAGGDREDMG